MEMSQRKPPVCQSLKDWQTGKHIDLIEAKVFDPLVSLLLERQLEHLFGQIDAVHLPDGRGVLLAELNGPGGEVQHYVRPVEN